MFSIHVFYELQNLCVSGHMTWPLYRHDIQFIGPFPPYDTPDAATANINGFITTSGFSKYVSIKYGLKTLTILIPNLDYDDTWFLLATIFTNATITVTPTNTSTSTSCKSHHMIHMIVLYLSTIWHWAQWLASTTNCLKVLCLETTIARLRCFSVFRHKETIRHIIWRFV